MRIETERDNAFKTNLEGTKSYTIKAGAKAFAVLSSQLYKNPIRAIIRELCCNAMDAHRAAGNDQPFKVFFPNSFSDEFAVEDHGVGMSPEEMDKIYHTYFESTKEGSDEDIGGFGIGSKTPFSYTSMFNVRSVKDGVETVSMSFLDADKIPQYNLIRTGKTDDPNGTRVSFSVKEDDYDKFYNEAVAVFAFLPYLPKIESGKEEIEEYLPRVNGEREWNEFETIRASIVIGNLTNEAKEFVGNVIGDSCFLMGGVPYRFDAYEAFKNDVGGDHEKIKRIRDFYRKKIVTPVKIGDVVVQPSREELSYEAKTLETAKRMFIESFRSFFDELLATKTLYEKLVVCKNHSEFDFLSTYDFSFDRFFSVGGRNVKIIELQNLFGTDILTDEVAATLCGVMVEAAKFNDALNGLNAKMKKKSKGSPSDPTPDPDFANFHVPIVRIRQNGKMKVAGNTVSTLKYNWRKDWTITELYDAMKEWTVTCSKEFWDLCFKNEPLNVNHKEWKNTKKVVLERTETMWRKNDSTIFVVNPASLRLLKKHGFPVLTNFEDVDKFEYKIERKMTKAAALKDAMVKVLFASSGLGSDFTKDYYTYEDVATRVDKLGGKLVWTTYEQSRNYYSEDNLLFLLSSYNQNASKESVRTVPYDSSFMSNLVDVAKSFGDKSLNDVVIVGIQYQDMKKAKLYEDLSDSMQRLFEEVSAKIFDEAKATATKLAVSREMNLYTQIRAVVRSKHGNLGCSEFEKILEGIEDQKSNAIDVGNKYDSVVNGFVKYGMAPGKAHSTYPEIVAELKEKLFVTYPLMRYADRSFYYGSNNKKIREEYADYVIGIDDLPLVGGNRIVAAATTDEQELQATA